MTTAGEKRPEAHRTAPAPHGGMRQYSRDGWALGGAAMSLVRGQTGLRRYVASAVAALLTVYVGVAALVLHFRHLGDVPERIVAVLAGAYLSWWWESRPG